MGSIGREAVDLLCDMRRKGGVGLSVTQCNVGISACAKGTHWLLPFELLVEMRQWFLEPNVVSYSAAITACLT